MSSLELEDYEDDDFDDLNDTYFQDKVLLAQCKASEAVAVLSLAKDGISVDEVGGVIMAFSTHTTVFRKGLPPFRMRPGSMLIMDDNDDYEAPGGN